MHKVNEEEIIGLFEIIMMENSSVSTKRTDLDFTPFYQASGGDYF